MSNGQLSSIFFLQMFFILAVCRGMGWLARRIGQPQAMGEMIAGVLMGPSLFGMVLPDLQRKLFPPDSLHILYVAAQLGIGLYMFLVGIDFKEDLFRSRMRCAAAVSVWGIIAPFILGAGLALWLLRIPGLFAPQVTLSVAMLFLGAAMSITAFPMLARIIQDRGLADTALGTLAMAAGAINDAVAWCVLALVLASFGEGSGLAVKAIGGGIIYGVLVLTAGRKILRRLAATTERAGRLTPHVMALTLMLLMLCAWTTDAIGIHAVFGGFLLGVAMPGGVLARELKRQLEGLTLVFLVPIFFTFSGLNTRLDLVNSGQMLFVALVVLLAACMGKAGACWAAARLSGEDNRTALALGALMNARGMMELIILNIGLQKGVIQAPLFSVMVLMAVLTTYLASPLFELFYGRHARKTGELGSLHGEGW